MTNDNEYLHTVVERVSPGECYDPTSLVAKLVHVLAKHVITKQLPDGRLELRLELIVKPYRRDTCAEEELK